MKEYNYTIIMEFIKWCEDNNDTEWMGYYNTAQDRVTKFIEWKYDNDKNIGCDATKFDIY